MADNASNQRERMRQVSEFIEQALRITRIRKRELGLADDALLDPEEHIDQQIAILRGLFLEAERSALPFDARDSNFWRILRARMQPAVLAYLTHERFVQSLDREALALRPDALTEVYRERLDNSDRFRQFFFELSGKLDQEALEIERKGSLITGNDHQTSYKTADDSAHIQGNVLKMLEKQLRDLEKEFNQQEALFRKSNEEVLNLKDILNDKNNDIGMLRRHVTQLEEDLVRHKLARDAAGRTDKYSAKGDLAGSLPALGDSAEDGGLQEKIMALEQELATTSDAAYNAFMSSSDLGIVILFMLSSFNCHTLEQLAQDMSRSISTFGLKVVVGVRNGAEYHYVASSGADIQLKSVLESHRGKGAIVEINHLLIYQKNCCVLIQESRRDDPERHARIKDNVGTLMKGAEARLEAIEAAQAVLRQKNQVEQLILRSYVVLQNVEKNMDKQQEKLSRLLSSFSQEMRKNLGVVPGDQKSIRLNMDLKKLEETLKDFFRTQDLIDPAFVKNISKVAQGIQAKQRGGES